VTFVCGWVGVRENCVPKGSELDYLGSVPMI
jgi:hypothetical protein